MLKLKKDKLEVLVKAVESYEGLLGAQHKEEGEEFDLGVSDDSGEESDMDLYSCFFTTSYTHKISSR